MAISVKKMAKIAQKNSVRGDEALPQPFFPHAISLHRFVSHSRSTLQLGFGHKMVPNVNSHLRFFGGILETGPLCAYCEHKWA